MNQTTLANLNALRVVAQEYLSTQKLSTSDIAVVRRDTRPVRLLSFDYYGTSSKAKDLIDINNRVDISYFNGNIKVLTDDNNRS